MSTWSNRNICFGDNLSALGAEPDKNKIKAILKMLCPANKKPVLKMMGMINFIGEVHMSQLLHGGC